MMKRAKNIESRRDSAISEKSKLLKNIESSDELKINFLIHNSKKLIEFKNVSLFYGDEKFMIT